MKVRFNIDYSTVYGENLVLNIVDNADAEQISKRLIGNYTKKYELKMEVNGVPDRKEEQPKIDKAQSICL